MSAFPGDCGRNSVPFVDSRTLRSDNPVLRQSNRKRSFMVQFGISTHMFHNRPLSVRHLELIREAGFERVEIWAMAPHIDYTSDAYMQKLADAVRAIGIQVVSFHGPFYLMFDEETFLSLSLGDPNRGWRKRLTDDLTRLIDLMPLFGAETLVAHGLGDSETEQDPDFAKKLVRESVGLLAPRLKKRGVRLAVENIHTHHSRTISLKKEMGLIRHPHVGICLDIAHANMNENPEKAVENCGQRLVHMHLSDNHGGEDQHLPPYEGTVPWRTVCRALTKAKNLRHAMLELMFPGMDDNQDVTKVRKLLAKGKAATDRVEAELENARREAKAR